MRYKVKFTDCENIKTQNRNCIKRNGEGNWKWDSKALNISNTIEPLKQVRFKDSDQMVIVFDTSQTEWSEE